MKIKIFLLLIVIVLFSCKKKHTEKQSDYQFYVQEADIYITTSKSRDGKFYVMFKNDDSLAVLSQKIDYIEFEIEHTPINIIFDLSNKNKIYVLNEFGAVKNLSKKYYDIKIVDITEFESSFFEARYKTKPLMIKPSFIQLYINSMTYTIYVNRKMVKEGDIYGGW